MKKVLYSLLIFASATLFAQKNTNIKFIVLGETVGTSSVIEEHKEFIQNVQVYKTPASLPQKLKKFNFIAGQGLTEIKYKKDSGPFDTVVLANLNEQFNLPKNTPVIIEGYEFKDTDTRIFAEIAQDVEVKDYNGVKSVFITTSTKK